MPLELPITIEHGKDGTLVHTARGSIRTRNVGEKLYFTFTGYVTVGMFDPSMEPSVTALATRRRVILIGDGEAWEGYEPGYRNRWTGWFLEHRKKIEAVHLLSKSKMVHMGAQVVNLALMSPLIRLYSERAAFERGVAMALKERVGEAGPVGRP